QSIIDRIAHLRDVCDLSFEQLANGVGLKKNTCKYRYYQYVPKSQKVKRINLWTEPQTIFLLDQRAKNIPYVDVAVALSNKFPEGQFNETNCRHRVNHLKTKKKS